MKKGQKVALIVIAIVVFGGIIYLGYDSSSPIADRDKPLEEEIQGLEEGVQTRNEADIIEPDAPKQSDPLTEETIPEESIKVEISSDGFNPSEFTVVSGSVVTIAFTVIDHQTYVFKFKDPSMQGVAVGVAPGETRSITFNAPAPGDYDFYSDVPGHEAKGLIGTMIVN